MVGARTRPPTAPHITGAARIPRYPSSDRSRETLWQGAPALRSLRGSIHTAEALHAQRQRSATVERVSVRYGGTGADTFGQGWLMAHGQGVYSFALFVAGATERSDAARSNLRMLCESRLTDGYELTVIDVMEQPELAEEKRILATPTVIRLNPLPQRRVVGDLSDQNRAAVALGIPDSGVLSPKRQGR